MYLVGACLLEFARRTGGRAEACCVMRTRVHSKVNLTDWDCCVILEWKKKLSSSESSLPWCGAHGSGPAGSVLLPPRLPDLYTMQGVIPAPATKLRYAQFVRPAALDLRSLALRCTRAAAQPTTGQPQHGARNAPWMHPYVPLFHWMNEFDSAMADCLDVYPRQLAPRGVITLIIGHGHVNLTRMDGLCTR
jgi:hypothetical protein